MAAAALVLMVASCKRELSQRPLVDEVRTILAGCLVHVSCRFLGQTLRPAFNTNISLCLRASYRVCGRSASKLSGVASQFRLLIR